MVIPTLDRGLWRGLFGGAFSGVVAGSVRFMVDGRIDELDRAGTCAFIDAVHTSVKRLEVDVMHATEHWADLHACVHCEGGQALRDLVPGAERGKVFGGDGNPEVLEFCVAELAAVQEMSPGAGVALLADILDLRFRHPRLRARVEALEVRLFRAREVVRRTRHLSAEAARWVDEQVADSATGQAWTRFLAGLDAAVILADPVLAEQRRRAAELDRGVRLGRGGEHGLKTLIARLRAADAAQLDAMASHLARILGALGDPDEFGVRRATALGYLANPLRTLDLLRRYQTALDQGTVSPRDPDDDPATQAQLDLLDPTSSDDGGDGGDGGGGESGAADGGEAAHDGEGSGEDGPVGEGDVHPADNDADDPDPQLCPACAGLGRLDPSGVAGAHAFARSATWLDTLDWKRLLPQVTLYVHTTRESLRHPQAGGVARMEGTGPITLGQLAEFFGTAAHLTVKDVIDLAGVQPADAYEASARIREAVHLLHPGDVFPYATCTTRTMDLDHIRPYRHHPDDDTDEQPSAGDTAGQPPPGQTHPAGLAPMTRFHHRIKTHSAWQVKHPETGVLLWRSPHGHYFQVHNGITHRLTPQAGQAYWDTCPTTPTDHTAPGTTPRDTPRQPRAPDSPLEQRFARTIDEYTLAG